MNKTAILSVVVVLIVLGLAWYGWANRSETPAEDETEESMGSLRDLLASEDPQECTFSQIEGEAETTGMVFVADARMRGDFETDIAGENQTGHVIVKNDTVYVWLDGQAQGVTMSLAGMTSATSTAQSPLDLEADNVEYECNDWTTDESKFSQPTNIQFMDLSALIGGSAGASATGTANPPQCAACDQLPETQRGQCRLALKCQ